MNRFVFLLIVFVYTTIVGMPSQGQPIEGSPYPHSTPVDELFLTSEDYSYSEKLCLQTLQGLLAKVKPEILRDTHGHKTIVANAGISLDYTYYNDFQGLLSFFADRLDGYILCEAREKSTNVAISLASIFNAVAIPKDIEYMAINAGLVKVLSVVGKDEHWALQEYGHLFSKSIASYQNCSDDRALFLGDYSVYTGAFQFWDDSSTGSLANGVYDHMEAGATFFGWGAGEYATVEQLSLRSMLIHPSDFSPNLSTLCNIPAYLPEQKDPIHTFEVKEKVHTVCFVISDGDNIQWLSGSSDNINNWNSPNRGRLNLGWTISPAMAELAPVIYRKYLDNCLTTQEGRNQLVAAPSGIGYYFPSIFPNLEDECAMLNDYMDKANLNIVNILDVDDNPHNPDEYLKQSNIDALFYYTYGANYRGMNGDIAWYKDKPSIGGRYTLWGNLSSPSYLAGLLNEESTNIHSENGYSLIPVHIWSRDVDDVLECISQLNPNVRVVAPDEFVWLIRKNIKNVALGNGNGLKGKYYTGSNFETFSQEKTNGKIDFNWGTASPLASNDFSIQWSGQIQPVYSEDYTFNVKAEGAVKLTINGVILYDSENGIESSTAMTLTAGEKYDIALDYKKTSDLAACRLEWESISQVLQAVPHTQLYSRPSPSLGLVTGYDECDYTGFHAGLEVGDYSLAQLTAKGFYDNTISSLQVSEGYKVVVYEGADFDGDSLLLRADRACLDLWKDKVSSIKVKTDGQIGLEGVYFLKNRRSNYNMDVRGGVNATANGAELQQWKITPNINQQFKLSHLSDGCYTITAMHSHKVLDVEDYSLSQGAAVQQSSYYRSENQQFIIIPSAIDGSYKIMAKHSGQLLGVANTNLECLISQYPYNDKPELEWKLIKVPEADNGSGDGLNADFYNGSNFETFRRTTTVPNIDYDWGDKAPNIWVNKDQFSIRWTGFVQARYTGNYTFTINSDNGRKLWINDQLIIDQWLNDYGVEYSGSISLDAGELYPISLEYFEHDGGASCQLYWHSDVQEREIIPQSQLYSISTAISEQKAHEKSISVFPTLVHHKSINVEYEGNKPMTVELYNLAGVLITKQNIAHSSKMSLDSVLSGSYIVSVYNDQQRFFTKIIII
ncbi:MAG: GxGYxYP family putative glycoside hydrolase [Bacteroidales bacterium]|jgi:hypothetical protein|nr:GxGYxYP family putative glycoside hydrolase [Bacteroidales bacterium]